MNSECGVLNAEFLTPRAKMPSVEGEMCNLTPFGLLSYLMSGGFRGPQMYPDGALPALQAVEKILAPVPALTAARMLVVLRRRE